jgi:hypothetical protein
VIERGALLGKDERERAVNGMGSTAISERDRDLF